jgi:serine/threonine-protein kinase RsbW
MTLTQSDQHDFFEKNTSLPYHDLDIERLQREIAEALHARDYPREGVFAVRLAVEEALVNAFRHGNQRDASKHVTFTCRIDLESASFEVADEGPGFDISSVPDPTDEANLEVPSGRGLLLMREYMSLLEFIEPGNRLRMVYRRLKD